VSRPLFEQWYNGTLRGTDLCKTEEELLLSLGWIERGMKEEKNHCILKVTDLCELEEEGELLLSLGCDRGEDEGGEKSLHPKSY
jgi:hypothetical protein